MGIASLTLGLTGLFAWLDPFIGYPVSVVGLILGAVSLWRAKEHRNKALAGLILSVIGLILCTIMVIGLLAFIIENVPDPYFRY